MMDSLDDAIHNSVPEPSLPPEGTPKTDHPAHDKRRMDEQGMCTYKNCDFDWDTSGGVPRDHPMFEKQFPKPTLSVEDRLSDIETSLQELHRKVDQIVEVVEATVNNLGNNPMMKMLSKLAPKA
jgi:hypothetical protein